MSSSPEVKHNYLTVNAIRMHVAEAGQGPAVILCHGFPESWYSWRHQMRALSLNGYRAIAPDMRGFGRTERPKGVDSYTQLHTVGDVIGLMDTLELAEAVVVGHDWGAPVAWNAALMRPDRIRAVAGLSIPYRARGRVGIMDALVQAGVTNFYMQYFQQPGVPEQEFQRDVTASIRKFIFAASGDAPAGTVFPSTVPAGMGILDAAPDTVMPLPWLTETDLSMFVQDYEEGGFEGAFNWYRNLHRNWELLSPFDGAIIRQPSMFLIGQRDATLAFPGMKSAVENLKDSLPGLRSSAVIAGAGHWLQQEAAQEVNSHILAFLGALSS